MSRTVRHSLKLLLGTFAITSLLLASAVLVAEEGRRDANPAAPVYGDSADIPAHDPSVNRPEATRYDEDMNVRQEPSGPDIAPGAERGSLVPIPSDNDGVIDPQ